jgi:F0F1-type ATP synthase membrane subunit c/vacuolar-type H+-ATPase subunit K
MTSKFLKKILKDPKKREKFFLVMTFAPIILSILVIIGFVIFLLIVTGVL